MEDKFCVEMKKKPKLVSKRAQRFLGPNLEEALKLI